MEFREAEVQPMLDCGTVMSSGWKDVTPAQCPPAPELGGLMSVGEHSNPDPDTFKHYNR